MREPRNPFRLRSSERIESDSTFVRFFSPAVLDFVQQSGGIGKVRLLRSAAGGGKTSLLRIFTPASLLTIHALRTTEDCKELYQRMVDLGAFSDDRPSLLGVMLSCAHGYAALADIGIASSHQERLLFALLDARLLLAALRAALALHGLAFPGDLRRLECIESKTGRCPVGLDLPCDGAALFDWAKRQEQAICDTLDSFEPSAVGHPSSASTLFTPLFLTPKTLLVDSKPIASHFVFLLDDVHKLHDKQRRALVQTLLDSRGPTTVWLAERLEALKEDELLSSGAAQGRDYDEVVWLESLWRNATRRFERFVLNVADRRAREAVDVDISAFGGLLQDVLGAEWDSVFDKAVRETSERVKLLAGSSDRFRDWVADRERIDGTLHDRALAWRSLEILLERERRRKQQTFEFAEGVDELQKKDDSSVKAAAELFIAEEYGVPYYYGRATLAKLASSNLEQFLWLAGDQFEEILGSALLQPARTPELTPKRQHEIIRAAADSLWRQIPIRVKDGESVQRFLDAIGTFSAWYTFRPNAPNDPGVNGTAIAMSVRADLLEASYLAAHPRDAELARVLGSALAHNLLDATLDYKCKGEKWMVLNLNRLLCVRYHLPLGYGLFKEQNLSRLKQWLDVGFRKPTKDEYLL